MQKNNKFFNYKVNRMIIIFKHFVYKYLNFSREDYTKQLMNKGGGVQICHCAPILEERGCI